MPMTLMSRPTPRHARRHQYQTVDAGGHCLHESEFVFCNYLMQLLTRRTRLRHSTRAPPAALSSRRGGRSTTMIERLPCSHVHAGEGFRHQSVMAPIARGIIIGFGVKVQARDQRSVRRLETLLSDGRLRIRNEHD